MTTRAVANWYRINNQERALGVIAARQTTTAWVADEIGVSRSYMDTLVRGTRNCREFVARRICEVLDMPPKVLFVNAETGQPARIAVHVGEQDVPKPRGRSERQPT